MLEDNNEPNMESLLRETLRRIRWRLIRYRITVVVGFVLVGAIVGYVADYFLRTRYLTITAVVLVVFAVVKAFRTEPTIQETIVEAFEQLKKKKGIKTDHRGKEMERIISKRMLTLFSI